MKVGYIDPCTFSPPSLAPLGLRLEGLFFGKMPLKGASEMKARPAKPGEGEIPVGASEVPGGGPQAYTDPETGERMINDSIDSFVAAEAAKIKTFADLSEYVQTEPAPKSPRKRK